MKKNKERPSHQKHKAEVAKNTSKSIIYAYLLVAGLAFIFYANSIQNDYALDDIYAVSGNSFVHQGFSGIPKLLSTQFFQGYLGDKEITLSGGRYRPLSLVTFAIEWQLFGKAPHISHFINVLLYVLTALLLLTLLNQLIPPVNTTSLFSSTAFLATLLFVIHPVHTEVVANIKGRDEILCFLFILLSWIFSLKYINKPGWKTGLLIFFCFFLAMMSKESAVSWMALIPISFQLLKKNNLRLSIQTGFILLAGALAFFALRYHALGGLATTSPPSELMDNPFLEASAIEKWATIIFTLGLYLKLLLFPHPLTWDYYPYHISLTTFSNPIIWLIVVIILTLGILVLYFWKRKPLISLGILILGIPLLLVSNIFFGIGAFMAERFLYVPSLGFALLLAFVFTNLLPRLSLWNHAKKYALYGLILITILAFFKTYSRNKVWKDDFTLYTSDVNTSYNSAKSNNIAGQWFAYKANQSQDVTEREYLFKKAISHLKKAIAIHPNYMDACFRLGNVYFDYRKDYDSTFNYYTKVLLKDSTEQHVWNNIGHLLPYYNDSINKPKWLETFYAFNSHQPDVCFHLGAWYAQHNQTEKAISLLEKTVKQQPQHTEALSYLGVLYYQKQQYRQSETYFSKALELKPDDKQLKMYVDAARLMQGKK